MTGALLDELHRDLPHREELLRHTRRAFAMLPRMERPRVLDLGCGRGDPTLELARLTGGEVVGVDIDQDALAELARRAEALGLSDRVRPIRMSMLDLDLPEGAFDLVWAEGSMHVVGLGRALTEWPRLLRAGGHIVVHEGCWLRPDPPEEIVQRWTPVFPDISSLDDYVARVTATGLEDAGHFALPESVWWDTYYGPIAERIAVLRVRHRDDEAATALLDREQAEVDLYRRHASWYGSGFFIARDGAP
jgi:SAM-dependent methyltransferase